MTPVQIQRVPKLQNYSKQREKSVNLSMKSPPLPPHPVLPSGFDKGRLRETEGEEGREELARGLEIDIKPKAPSGRQSPL